MNSYTGSIKNGDFTWKQIENGDEAARDWDMTKWFHDLIRPSLRPYDPKEIAVIKRFNALADEDGQASILV